MKGLWMTAVGIALTLIAGSELAFAESRPSRKAIRQMTCAEFLRVDDAAKPEIVHWLAIRDEPTTHKGIVVDVDVTDRMVPTVVDSCRDVPTASLSQKVRAEADRLGAKLYTATTPTSTQ